MLMPLPSEWEAETVAKRIAITFASWNALDLEGIADNSAGLPAEVPAVVNTLPPPAFKSGGPDEWRQVVQVVIGLVDDPTKPILYGVVGSWLYDKLKGLRDDGRRGTVNHVRVFVNHVEIQGAELDEIKRAVREAVGDGSAAPGLPPQLTEPPPEQVSSHDDWVARELKRSSRYHEEVERLKERTERRHEKSRHQR